MLNMQLTIHKHYKFSCLLYERLLVLTHNPVNFEKNMQSFKKYRLSLIFAELFICHKPILKNTIDLNREFQFFRKRKKANFNFMLMPHKMIVYLKRKSFTIKKKM